MKRLVVPTAIALVLALSGTAWAQCSGYSKESRTTAEAPVEKPVETAPQS